jgi:hypothetical protein
MDRNAADMIRRTLEDLRLRPELYDFAAKLKREASSFDHFQNLRMIGDPFKALNGMVSGTSSQSLGKLLNETVAEGSALGAAIQSIADREAFLGKAFALQIEKWGSFDSILDRIGMSSSVSSLLPTPNWLEMSAKAIKTPWIDVAEFPRSIESLACLHSVGKALTLSPYEGLGKSAVDALFGKLQGIKIPSEAFLDWQARLDFYRNTGFDERLTLLPEPAFTQSLNLSEIIGTNLLAFPSIPKETAEPSADEEEKPFETVKQRMVSTYDILLTFEIQLRDSLIAAMTDRFGPKWDIQRVPGPILNSWRRKRQEAVNRSEPVQPLIHYADFTDYVQIVIRKDNWNEIFSPAFCNLDDAKVSFQRLHPIRLCTMHARPITKDDFLLLLVETQRILKALGNLKKQ